MATITQSDGRGGITLPVWFLGSATAAFLTVSLAVGAALIGTWATANGNYQKNLEQDNRLNQLERSQLDMSAMKTDIANVKEMQKSTNDKLDRLLEAQFGRRGR